MPTITPWLCWLFLICLSATRPLLVTSSPDRLAAPGPVQFMVNVARGRVLGSLIDKGMPERQVTKLLGSAAARCSGPQGSVDCYTAIGVFVYYGQKGSTVNPDRRFVEKVEFCPVGLMSRHEQ
jgi:hypothetical protein